MLTVSQFVAGETQKQTKEKNTSPDVAAKNIFAQFLSLMGSGDDAGSAINVIGKDPSKAGLQTIEEQADDSILAGALINIEITPELLEKITQGNSGDLSLKDILKHFFGDKFNDLFSSLGKKLDVNIDQIQSNNLKFNSKDTEIHISKENNSLNIKLFSSEKKGLSQDSINKISHLSEFGNLKVIFFNKELQEVDQTEKAVKTGVSKLNESKPDTAEKNPYLSSLASEKHSKDSKSNGLKNSGSTQDANNSKVSFITSSNVQNDTFGQKGSSEENKFMNNFEFANRSDANQPKAGIKESEAPLRTFNNVKAEEIKHTASRIVRNTPDGGSTSARINLYPKSLGRVFVEVNMNGINATVNIRSANKETLKIIEQQLPALKEGLKLQGINVENIGLKFAGEENGFNQYLPERKRESRDQSEKKKFLESFGNYAAENDNEQPVVRNIFRQGSYIERYI